MTSFGQEEVESGRLWHHLGSIVGDAARNAVNSLLSGRGHEGWQVTNVPFCASTHS